MHKLLSAVTLFLTSFLVHAAVGDGDAVASAPVEMVDVGVVVLFVILFFGSIAWFFIQIWKNEKNTKQDQ